MTQRPPFSRARRSTFHALVAVAALSCHDRPETPPSVEGSGVLKSESREVPSFHSIELRGALKVELTNGPLEKMVLSGDDNLLPIVSTTVADDVLVIRETQNATPKSPLTLVVHAPDVRKVAVHGVANLVATGLNAPSFNLVCQGSANAEVKGQVGALNVELNGVGRVNAGDLVAKSAKVKLSGTGNVDVNATDALDATVSGVGSVRYRGSPKVEQHVSGVGKVEPLK